MNTQKTLLLQKLKMVRLYKGLKQGQLAELAGLAQGQYSLIESGATTPNLETLLKIVEALGCQLDIRRPDEIKTNSLLD